MTDEVPRPWSRMITKVFYVCITYIIVAQGIEVKAKMGLGLHDEACEFFLIKQIKLHLNFACQNKFTNN